jgi:hypothetical protein
MWRLQCLDTGVKYTVEAACGGSKRSLQEEAAVPRHPAALDSRERGSTRARARGRERARERERLEEVARSELCLSLLLSLVAL